jgi:hypothetical protein
MFVGHFGVAFAAKRATPHTNLALLVLAAEFIDVIWPIFVLLGIERVHIEPDLTPVTPLNFTYYPWTHSVLMSVAWGLVLGAVYYSIKRDKQAAIVLALVVVSHWFLDFVSHIPDLPLIPSAGAKYGLGLWHSRIWTAIVELTIFFGGIAIYLRSTRVRDRAGSIGLVAYILFLTFIYLLNIQGTPPPSVKIMAVSSEIGTLILFLWAWWVDRHRESTV